MIGHLQATVLRSTPLRLTGILIGLFLASFLLSLGVAFLVIRDSIDEGIHVLMAQEFASYQLINDQADLEERVAQEVAVATPRTLILMYQADSGTRLGNVPALPLTRGVAIVQSGEIHADNLAASYLVESRRIGNGALTLAYSRQQVIELGEVFWSVFLISPLVTLVLSGMIGLWVARGARARVEAIRSTLSDLTRGNLEAKVPLTGDRRDDLSQIGVAVNRMASAQAVAVASLKQVSADIAHDLKTPIQRVSVLLERLGTQGELSAQQWDTVDAARRETDQIVKTFQSLLQIAQLEGGRPHESFRRVDLWSVAGGIVEVYEPAAEESGHHLSLTVEEGDHFTVRGERNLLGQVVANLIENALRHTPQGSRIIVGLWRDADQIVLAVADDGPGIPPEEHQNVLRRLYRLEHSRTSEGSGLGLSLVAAICALHDATLTLHDAGPGLEVVIRLAAE